MSGSFWLSGELEAPIDRRNVARLLSVNRSPGVDTPAYDESFSLSRERASRNERPLLKKDSPGRCIEYLSGSAPSFLNVTDIVEDSLRGMGGSSDASSGGSGASSGASGAVVKSTSATSGGICMSMSDTAWIGQPGIPRVELTTCVSRRESAARSSLVALMSDDSGTGGSLPSSWERR